MCILCVASRWSRRIVTMLPWLIIPLIILWALSQLLPSQFRFEVTSPRLACVGVLLISLGWYELAMPRLSSWRARRSALLRERRRMEAQEAAKWRKEATRRCRNCLTPYRDQTPGGGKFMCTFCGHVSKRPVLEIPGQDGSCNGGAVTSMQGPNGGGGSLGNLSGQRSSRGWGRGGGWARSWTHGKGWTGGPATSWGAGTGSWNSSSLSGRNLNGPGTLYWGGGGSGGTLGGNGFGGFFFGTESCATGDSQSGGLIYVLLQSISFVFLCLKWLWRRLWSGERHGEDGGLNGGRRGGQRRGEDVGISHGSRGDKARRKAEEKRQARLEREKLDAEEKRQREEVARLVEERRRLRDEKVEAEKESEREAAAERERELRREREAERRRQEKVKEREKEQAKEKSRDIDLEESKRRKDRKESDKKADAEKRGEAEKKGSPVQSGEPKKAAKGSRVSHVDVGQKAVDVGVKPGSSVGGKFGSSRYVGTAKGPTSAAPKTGAARQNTGSFWGKGLTGGRALKGPALSGHVHTTATNGTLEVPNSKHTDSSSSSWNRMPWTKVWGKSSTSPAEGNVALSKGVSGGRTDSTSHGGTKSNINSSSGIGVSDPSPMVVELKQPVATPSQSRSWQRLFSNSNSNLVFPAPPSDMDGHHEHQLNPNGVVAPEETITVPLETESSLVFGQGIQLPHITNLAAVTLVVPPVQTPALSFAPASPTSAQIGSANTTFTSIHPASGASNIGLPPLVPKPIGKPIQIAPVSNPVHVPAPIQMPSPATSQSQSHVPQDQLPQILDPWGQRPLSLDNSTDVPREEKWQMWDSPQLDQIQLSNITEPLGSWSHLNSSFREPRKDTLRSPSQPVDPLPASLFSPQPTICPGSIVGDCLGTLPAGSGPSLWSDQSAYESTMRIWDDSETHQHIPPEFVDCITQEVMEDPVITADGHSYERAAIERWLRTHDTSPMTGEVLPAPPGGYGSGVDKTLRPNHILRGQIIEYKESMARLVRGSTQESGRENSWSVGLSLGSTAWSERPQIAGFYTTPSAQSVWSYDGSQNPQNAVSPLI